MRGLRCHRSADRGRRSANAERVRRLHAGVLGDINGDCSFNANDVLALSQLAGLAWPPWPRPWPGLAWPGPVLGRRACT